MNISSFIRDNMEAILQEWEDFSASIQPNPGSMSKASLRDNTKVIMTEIADELETAQSEHEQAEKSKGRSLRPVTRTAAEHGSERLEAGFGITDLIGEYRALRATVIRLYDEMMPADQMDLYDLVRFNEAIDQRVHEAIDSYSTESELRKRQLAYSPDHNYILDRQGKFLYANRAMLLTLHISRDELEGKSHFDLNFSSIADLQKTFKEAIQTSSKGYGEVKYCSSSGEILDFEFVLTPVLDDEKKVIAVVSTERDITSRKQSTEALRRSRDQLLAANQELEERVQETQSKYLHTEKLAEVGKWSASIAHELNNPLQAVMGFLKGLRRWSELEERDMQTLDSAISEINRMSRLIRTVNDVTRASSGKKRSMDVNQSINSLLLLSKNEFKRKGIATVVNYAEELPHILAVQDQIKQVFLNLLRNAADACQEGGVITISTWQEAGGRVAVSIKDDGVGIPPEQMDLLFQPFYTTKPDDKGTGLGLTVCKDIVHNHNGEIRAKSKPGEGSVFTVLLPIEEE